MTKADIVEDIAQRTGLTKKEVAETVAETVAEAEVAEEAAEEVDSEM